MFWLFNNNNDNEFSFYQVFLDYNIVYNENNNIIFSLESSKTNGINNLNNYKCTEINMEVKQLDNLILYINKSTEKNETYIFETKMKFSKPSENKYNAPIFNLSYKKANKHKMPNLIDSYYSFNKTLLFKIFQLNNNVLFVIETDPVTNIQKKYWIVTELNFLNNYLKFNTNV